MNKYNDSYNIFYPKKKIWFEYYINRIKNFNKKVLNTMVYYKNFGYQDLNNVLFNDNFPLIYYFNKYSTNILNTTLINTTPLYIFPNDLEKIKKYHQEKIISHIENIDNLLLNNNFELDDCILFRGYSTNKSKKKYEKNSYLSQEYNNFFLNKDKECLIKTYSSFTFNPKVALNFIRECGYLLILRINKKDNIPGLFLSNKFFNKDFNTIDNYNKITYDEMEVLICRNLNIKILHKKEITINSNTSRQSINDIYKEDTKSINNEKIKIIYAESLPFTKPEKFNPSNDYKYICV